MPSQPLINFKMQKHYQHEPKFRWSKNKEPKTKVGQT